MVLVAKLAAVLNPKCQLILPVPWGFIGRNFWKHRINHSTNRLNTLNTAVQTEYFFQSISSFSSIFSSL